MQGTPNNKIYNLETIIKARHHLHQNPELAWKEFNTQSYLMAFLGQIGIEESAIQKCAGTGLVVTIKGTGPSNGQPKTIALRADIDGLPMKEESNHPYKSQTEAAHMCGHDGHMALMLGAIMKILDSLNQIPSNKTVKIFFQPAEEGERGARQMVKEGCMEGVDEVFGLHNWPMEGKTEVACADREMMAACAIIKYKIVGRGGHGSMPQSCSNPVPVAAKAYVRMQEIIDEAMKNDILIRCSIPEFVGSLAFNVIPATCTIGGSVRYFDKTKFEALKQSLDQAITETCESFNNKEISVEISDSIFAAEYPVINTPELAQFVRQVAVEVYGGDQELVEAKEGLPVYGSEDFPEFGLNTPSCFFFTNNRACEKGVTPHHPRYNFDDNCIEKVTEIWLQIVLKRLN